MMTIAIPPRPKGRGILAQKLDEEKEYYQIILEIFEDFIEEEKLNKIKDKLVKENTISIINI